MQHSRTLVVSSWVLRSIVAAILLQTLYFKFSGASESVYIFSALGLEPGGRIATGIAELIASVLLLIPATAACGAVLSLAVISGAIVAHVARLGIALPAVGDRGELFALAIVVFACSLTVVVLHRNELPFLRTSARSAAFRTASQKF